MKVNGMRVLVWIMLNLFLIAAILFVLDYFQIWSVSDFYKSWSKADPEIALKAEDPYLIEKEELKKQKLSLDAREEILKAKENSLKELIKLHDEFKTAMIIKNKQLEEQVKKIEDQEAEKTDRTKNIKYLAEVIGNMPPDAAVERLGALAADDALLVIDIFSELDKIAAELGQGSLVPLYVSKMDVKQAQEIMRLKAQFPGENVENGNDAVNNANEEAPIE